MMDLFLTNTQVLDSSGLLVVYCNVFISCLDSHSDGTHSLERIHWWASDAFLQIWWRNKLIYILDGLGKYSQIIIIIIFWWTIPLSKSLHFISFEMKEQLKYYRKILRY